MKRTLLIAALFTIIFSASAYTGYEGPDNGMHVMGGENPSSPASIERNGTDWQMTFEEINKTTENTSTGVLDHSFKGNNITFQGVISTPTPCHTLNAKISDNGRDSYTYSISSNKTSNSSCEQVISYRKYNATFEYERPFKITINHSGSETKTLKHPGFGREGEFVGMPGPGSQERGPIQKLIDWVKSLFSDEPERISTEEVRGEKISGEDVVYQER